MGNQPVTSCRTVELLEHTKIRWLSGLSLIEVSSAAMAVVG